MNHLSRRSILCTIASLLAGMVLAASVPAHAQTAPADVDKIDLSMWTCQRFLEANSADVSMIIAWLDGYYKNENDPPIIDSGDLPANSRKLKEYCTAHPDMGFDAATDILFERE
jgi:acid stress chaperone HdeB